MQTTHSKEGCQTHISDADRQILARIIEVLGLFVPLEPIGRYVSMSADEVWLTLVIQVCVMGSARPIERLTGHPHPERYKDFEKAVALSTVVSQQNPAAYLSKVLKCFSATRFHQKSANKLVTVLSSPDAFNKDEGLLFDGLSHQKDAIETRDELIRRCPILGLKSASDFMISVGLSHDVIALDTRVIGIFRKYFGYNLTSGQVQSKREFYLSLEGGLRELCREKQVSLAFLDRLLFKFGNVNAIELIVKYLSGSLTGSAAP
jgi:thermostable 8-oxoguanine DNA glycosylase